MKTKVYEEIFKRVSINTAGVINISTYNHNSLLISSKINGTFSKRTIDTFKRIFDCDVKFFDDCNKNIIVVTMDVPNAIAFVDKDVPADENEVDNVTCGFLLTTIEIEEEED